jgi:glycosyltransferase involved in cell wall biosynthesis
MKYKVFLVSNIFPLYREALWKDLAQSNLFQIDFFFNPSNPMGIKPCKDFKYFSNYSKMHFCKGLWLFNKILVWQKGVLKASLVGKFDAIILLGDMYNLSTWLAAIISRLRKKQVIFWSHGFYGNEVFLKKIIRHFFFQIPNDHILYSDLAKEIMVMRGFKKQNLHVVYNSLDFKNQNIIYKKLKKQENPITFFENNNLPLIIYSGRLIKEKKVELLINAVNELNNKNNNYNLLIVGDGPNKQNLERMLIERSSKNVFFYGSCYNEEEIAKLIFYSNIMVSPGNIGLAAIHSLTYGTPVLTHDNFSNQMPEVEIIKENVNGNFFAENSIESLKFKIRESINNNFKKSKCRELVKEKYNTNFQIKIFNSILH